MAICVISKNYEFIQDQDAPYTMEFNRKNINLIPITLYAKSLEDFIEVSSKYELNYISINKNGVEDIFYPYLDEIYENEEKFPYLTKIYDSVEQGYDYHLKIFRINYEIFESIEFS